MKTIAKFDWDNGPFTTAAAERELQKYVNNESWSRTTNYMNTLVGQYRIFTSQSGQVAEVHEIVKNKYATKKEIQIKAGGHKITHKKGSKLVSDSLSVSSFINERKLSADGVVIDGFKNIDECHLIIKLLAPTYLMELDFSCLESGQNELEMPPFYMDIKGYIKNKHDFLSTLEFLKGK